MTELRRPNEAQITVRPMTEEEADRVREFLQQSQELLERIKKRRKGKPIPPSWPLIRQDREQRSKSL